MATVDEIREEAYLRFKNDMENKPTYRELWFSSQQHLITKGYEKAKKELATQWIPLTDWSRPDEKEMVVFKAFGVKVGSVGNYDSDPYCGWIENGEITRWPHQFKPTHFMRLPEEPSNAE